MPTKTGEKIRIIVLGTGSDAELVRSVAQSDADVALAAKFTKTVTHLVVDDTVKPTEARIKKAEEAGVPVLSVAEFQGLLTAGEEDEVEEAADEPEAEADVESGAEEMSDALEPEEEPAAEPEPAVEAASDAPASTEDAPVAESIDEPEEEPVVKADEDYDGHAELDAADNEQDGLTDEDGDGVLDEAPAEPAPVAEAIDEPEEEPADPEKAVPSQAEAPDVESDDKADKAPAAKPSFIDRIKSIFGLTAAKK